MTIDIIKQVMNHCPDVYAEEIIKQMDGANINTPLRQSAFLAQIAHESSECRIVEENLNYSSDGLLKVFGKYFSDPALASLFAHKPETIANYVYANRIGNGDIASGDGWRYHGRGVIQITGKNNYKKCGDAISQPLLENPSYLLTPAIGVQSAIWFWVSNSLNELADIQNFKTITKRINGGYNGLNERLAYYNKAKTILGV